MFFLSFYKLVPQFVHNQAASNEAKSEQFLQVENVRALLAELKVNLSTIQAKTQSIIVKW